MPDNLALRMRPKTIDQVIGQKHLVGPGKIIRRMVEANRLSSMILYGPPGTGKTTIARLVARFYDVDSGQLRVGGVDVKNLTTAEGGAVTWRPELGLDEELYRQYMLLSLHGQSKDALSKTRLGAWEYDVVSPAYKCNMTDVCAAIGLAQMTRYDSMLERRRQIITRYDQALAPAGVTSLRHYEDGSVSSGHLYLANLPGLGEDGRNEFIEHMARADVACNVHYKPLPMLTAYRDLGFDIEDFPRAFDLYANEVSLPLHTSLSDEQVDYVIDCALDALAAVGR